MPVLVSKVVRSINFEVKKQILTADYITQLLLNLDYKTSTA